MKNITLIKKASILAVIAVTALSMSACGDMKKSDDSKKDTASSVAAPVEVSTADEEIAVAAPAESKAEEAPKAEEKLEMTRAEISNNTGIDVYVIQILDKDGKCIADLLKDGAFLSTGFAQSFEIPSGEALTVRYGPDENTVYDVEKVNTSICSTIRLGLNVNEPSVECITKDGETTTIVGTYVEGHEYTDNYDETNNNGYDYNANNDNGDDGYTNNGDNGDDGYADNGDNGDDGYTDNGDNGQGGCVGDDALTF